MTQIQVPKISSYTAVGPNYDQATVTKLSIYVLLVPGVDGPPAPTPTNSAYAYSQIRRVRNRNIIAGAV